MVTVPCQLRHGSLRARGSSISVWPWLLGSCHSSGIHLPAGSDGVLCEQLCHLCSINLHCYSCGGDGRAFPVDVDVSCCLSDLVLNSLLVAFFFSFFLNVRVEKRFSTSVSTTYFARLTRHNTESFRVKVPYLDSF